MMASAQALVSESDLELVPLTLLRAGQKARVGEIVGAGDLVHRLREMGLHDGALVQMVRPGSPCIIKVHGHRLGFRMNDIARVLVRISEVKS
jgi:ferrous iron transport protein A